MKTASDFYRMRDKGRLFVCREHGMSDVGSNGEVLLVVFAPPGTVEMGFCREALGRSITDEIAKDAWYADTWYRTKDGFRPAARTSGDDVTWPQWANAGSFLFHRPTQPLPSEFEEVPSYFRQLKLHELRRRYNKPPEPPKPPPILSLVDAIPKEWNAVQWEELLGHAADRCAFTTYWPEYDDGFGEHFYLFPCREDAGIPGLQSIAHEFDSDFEITTLDRIPRH